VLDAARAHACEVDAAGAFPQTAVDALRALGLLGLTLRADAGGLGGGPRELVEAVHRLAAACGSTAMVYLMHLAAAMAVALDPPQARPELVGRFPAGDTLATLVFLRGGLTFAFLGTGVAEPHRRRRHAGEDPQSRVTSAGHADV
jgi:alkylation response protein AidB-like acyl-CoA dehydrogenase